MLKLFKNLTLATALLSAVPAPAADHTFEIGKKDFLLDGERFQMRCGEIHFARVPKEYWRHRLQLCKAMGLNTVCAYLFWNLHEFEEGTYNWSGQADAVEFCKLAQEEGLWVVLRPGPYACAEWDGGGLPWWLLKKEDIALRSRDPDFLAATQRWLAEVGRVLGPMQVTHGGPILMAQVENEYGFYGKDAEYMGELRQVMIDSGFDIPLFNCNPRWNLRDGYRDDLFSVVNFGSDPAGSFEELRKIQKDGPLVCGEFYPGWFDTWGAPHHLGNLDQNLADLDYMLKEGASFSIYMAHGGTSFGMWAGADRPFKPDTSSYDYDAPISEAGWIGDKFDKTRALMKRYLLPGETLPDPPAAMPVISVPEFTFSEVAPIYDNLPKPVMSDTPKFMEAYDQGHGAMLYRTKVPAGPSASLELDQVHDFAWVRLDGKNVGIMDRRSRRFKVVLPPRDQEAVLDILVHTMGHVNFGKEIHDRKGISGDVRLGGESLKGPWGAYSLPLDDSMLASLKWQPATGAPEGPKFWRSTFSLEKAADTYLDLRSWGKGVIWINGHCLARYWNIGPTQTAYVPGPWLQEGDNEIIILDLVGPEKASSAGLETPILNELRPELDFARGLSAKAELKLDGVRPIIEGSFDSTKDAKTIEFKIPAKGSQFCLEALSSHDGKPFAAIAELDLLDRQGHSISHATWKIAYASSEEMVGEDGSATNAINGQISDFWHTEWKNAQPGYPHRIVIDLGQEETVAGFKLVPRAGNNPGDIAKYRAYVGNGLAVEKE
ncbi:beta-galactosidase [Haloferula luteola]|uniref:Beta-galactosidase n=1 Tax=Haloferula luteola TaxID=595692 RepID=A0A840UZZ6_9BACT|nr:beta-galactosidase [Haloferula luteola]MBB5351687.1 beta-galactosidase [Haloferula luteola]